VSGRLNFYLIDKFKTLVKKLKSVVFTTHTPEMAGNEVFTFCFPRENWFRIARAVLTESSKLLKVRQNEHSC